MTSPSTAVPSGTLGATPTSDTNISSGRFLWVDAIRGLACMAVVIRHLSFPFSEHPGLALLFPAWLQWLHIVTAAGVYAFFVLSGFVIAHSLRSNVLSPKSVGNFILRRQVRLDPPYWVALLLFTLVPRVLPQPGAFPSFSPANFVMNAFYLQGLLHKQSIIGPAWTLCIEIQFYLVFIAILFVGKFGKRIVPENNVTRISLGVIAITGLFALFFKFVKFFPYIFISHWHYFALGVLSYYAFKNIISLRFYGVFLAAFLISLIASPPAKIMNGGSQHSLSLAAMVVAFVTAVSLVYAGRNGKMEVWGNTPILQYLGKISYTLYLVHVLVIIAVGQMFSRYIGQPWPALGIYFLSIAVSIGVAHILNVLIERPSMKLAARLKSA